MILKVTKMNFKQNFTCCTRFTSNTKTTFKSLCFCYKFSKIFLVWPPESHSSLPLSLQKSTVLLPYPPRWHTRCMSRCTACSTAHCWTVCINWFLKNTTQFSPRIHSTFCKQTSVKIYKSPDWTYIMYMYLGICTYINLEVC